MHPLISVYVAGSSFDLKPVREMMRLIDENTTTRNVVDWTEDVDDWDALEHGELIERNFKAHRDIMTADVVVAVMSEEESVGREMIIGMAYGFGIPLIIVHHENKTFKHFFTNYSPRVAMVRDFEQVITALNNLGPEFSIGLGFPSQSCFRDVLIDQASKFDNERGSVGDVVISIAHDLENMKNEISMLLPKASTIRRRSMNRIMDRLKNNISLFRKQYDL